MLLYLTDGALEEHRGLGQITVWQSQTWQQVAGRACQPLVVSLRHWTEHAKYVALVAR